MGRTSPLVAQFSPVWANRLESVQKWVKMKPARRLHPQLTSEKQISPLEATVDWPQ